MPHVYINIMVIFIRLSLLYPKRHIGFILELLCEKKQQNKINVTVSEETDVEGGL